DTLIAPAPAVHRLLEVLESPRAGAGAIAVVLEGDVGLAAKILQVANSSFYAPRARAVSLDVAVARLGAQTIRSLALMDGFARRLDGRDPVLGRWLAAFNDHAGETARLAQRLAEPRLRADAFCAGLLHECGQLVLASCRPVVFSAHLRLQDGRPALCGEIEEETFGVTHSRAGAYLLSLWGFPLEVVAAAAGHDGPLDGLDPRSVTGAVLLAHQLVEAERVRSSSPSSCRRRSTISSRVGRQRKRCAAPRVSWAAVPSVHEPTRSRNWAAASGEPLVVHAFQAAGASIFTRGLRLKGPRFLPMAPSAGRRNRAPSTVHQHTGLLAGPWLVR